LKRPQDGSSWTRSDDIVNAPIRPASQQSATRRHHAATPRAVAGARDHPLLAADARVRTTIVKRKQDRRERLSSVGMAFASYFFFAVLASFFGFLVSFFCALLPLAMVSS
jgi:hypothetical protein